MNENIDLTKILKDCPKGTKLYSSVYGDVEFVGIYREPVLCIPRQREDEWLGQEIHNSKHPILFLANGFEHRVSSGGEMIKGCGECTFFPSKDQRDWSKFNPKNEELVPPCEFKDGDILSYQCGCLKNRTIYIYRYHKTLNTAYYVALSGDTYSTFRIKSKGECALNGYDHTVRFATEEEKQKLFDAIKLNGYKWNAETKTLEKLVEPRFKVSDWVVFITSKSVYKVEKKENYEYTLRHILGGSMCLPFSNEKLIREWTIEDAKDGDVLADEYNNICIFKKCEDTYWHSYIYLGCDGKLRGLSIGGIHKQTDTNPSTKEQRDALMKAMNDNGYEWDDETKTLKKLVKHKFDPSTLKPFDRVLVRLTRDCIWNVTFFSHYDKEVNWGCCPCVTTSCKSYNKCIPYNDETKHLLGTSDEAPEYYRYWED